MNTVNTNDIDADYLHRLMRHFSAPISGGSENVLLFALFDKTAQRFAPPTPAYNPYIVVRSVAQIISSTPSSPIALYPDDFVLHCIGSYNEVTGVISAFSPPFSGSNPTRIGSVRELITLITPADLIDFMRSAVSHSDSPASSAV